MKWADYKQEITALNSSEIKDLEIVAQLIHRRQELNLTQSDLANKAGLKQAAIARLESGKVIPRLDTLDKITKALDLKISLVKEDNTLYHAEVIEKR